MDPTGSRMDRLAYDLPARVALTLLALVTTACVTREPPPSVTRPVVQGPKVTWHRDVLPIVQRHCAACHSESGVAPFTLDFREAHERHKAVAASVMTRLMPPWMPASGCQRFRGERLLSQSEVETIVTWSREGAPEGPGAQAPPPPPSERLSWVDATLTTGPYTPQATPDEDDYRCFAIDPKLDEPRDLVGFEIEPGAPKLVHHVVLYSASFEEAQAQDARDRQPGWSCFGGPGTRMPLVVGGWAPGTPATTYPEGTGIRIPARKALVVQVHYTLGRLSPAEDNTTIRLQFSREPVARPASILPLSKRTFRIPPRTVGHRETRSYVMPAEATLWGLMPHMHARGRQIRAMRNDACLIDIPSWDFNWHQFYFYAGARGIQLVPGDRIELTCTWDNPTDRPIEGGEGAGSEICMNYLYLTY